MAPWVDGNLLPDVASTDRKTGPVIAHPPGSRRAVLGGRRVPGKPLPRGAQLLGEARQQLVQPGRGGERHGQHAERDRADRARELQPTGT
jgi:hypothetical protein